MSNTKSSWVWNFFDPVDYKKAKCRVCQKVLARPNYTTTGLKKHLNFLHKIFDTGSETVKTVKSEMNSFDGLEPETSSSSQEKIEEGIFKTQKGEEPFKKSWVRKYYELSNNVCLCQVCNQVVSPANSSKCLRRHLKLHNIHVKSKKANSSKVAKKARRSSESSDSSDTEPKPKIVTKDNILRSWVWEYFKKVPNQLSICKICKKFVKRKNYNTSVMSKHLKNHNIFGSTEKAQVDENFEASEHDFEHTFHKSKTEEGNTLPWEYFEDLPDYKCFCKLCKKIISTISTKEIRKHLQYHNISESSIKVQEATNCYVCDASLGLHKHEISTPASFTKTPLHEILDFFTGDKITLHERQESAVCTECFTSLDSYDELQMQARQIQKKLMSSFLEKRQHPERIFIKQEPEFVCADVGETLSVMELPDLNIEDSEAGDFPSRDDVRSNDDEMSQTVPYNDKTSNGKDKREPNNKNSYNGDKTVTKAVYQCNYCKMTLDDRQEFVDHIRCHNEEKKGEFSCDKCPRTFKNKNKLEMHLACDHIPPGGPYDCPVCFKTYKTSYNLRSHYYIHTTERDYLCVTCGASFQRRNALASHMLNHNEYRPIACEVEGCPRRFRNISKLKIHLRVHTGEKIFECSFCPGKRFAQKWGLDLHVKGHHKQEVTQPEKCLICGMKIPSKAKLKLHLSRIHQVVD